MSYLTTTSCYCPTVPFSPITVNHYMIVWTSGANSGQARQVATFIDNIITWTNPLTTIPSAGDTFDFYEMYPQQNYLYTLGKYAWNYYANYPKYTRVIGSNGSVYIALIANTHNNPITDTYQTYWALESSYYSGLANQFFVDITKTTGFTAVVIGGYLRNYDNSALIQIPTAYITLLPNSINYIEVSPQAKRITLNIAGEFNPAFTPVAKITTNASGITAITPIYSSSYLYETKRAFSMAVTRTLDVGYGSTSRITALEFNGIAYCFGGISGGTPTNQMWSYNLITNLWVQLSPTGTAPPGTYYAANCQYKGNLFYIGGITANYPYNTPTCTNAVYSYQVSTNTWNLVSTTGSPPNRAWGSYWQVGNLLYLSGGTNGTAVYNDLWTFNLDTDTFTLLAPSGPAPTAYCCGAAYYYNGIAYILTGYTNASCTNSGAGIVAYNLVGNSYTALTPSGAIPTGVGEAFVWGVDSNIYLVNGASVGTGNGLLQSLVYNIPANKWSTCYPGGYGLPANAQGETLVTFQKAILFGSGVNPATVYYIR